MDLLCTLPQEIIEEILGYLSTRELCVFVQLSKNCYSVGSSSKLWNDVRISKKTIIKNVLTGNGSPLPLDIARFKNIKQLDISYLSLLPKDWWVLLFSIKSTREIESVDISYGQNLEYVEDNLIGDALAGIRKVSMKKVVLPPCRLNSILDKMINNKITKELDISLVDLSQIPISLFKDMVDNLELINLKNCYLESQQIGYLFNMGNDRQSGGAKIEFSAEGTQLYDAMSVCDNVTTRELLPNMFSQLSGLDFRLVDFSSVSTEMWTALFRFVSPDMDSLSIEGMGLDLVNVPVDVLAGALVKPRELRLSGPDMSPLQWTAFFKKLTTSTETLCLRMVNLSFGDIKLIGQAILNVRNLTMNYVCFETEQWNYLFQTIFPKIQNVSVVNINLSEMKDSSLAATVRRCREVSLSSTYLNHEQRTLVLNTVKLNTNLKYLNLAGLILIDTSADLLANVVASIPVVNLAATKLASKQTTAIFSRLLGSCRLRELDLGGLSLGQVPSRLLALALSRLRRVSLVNTIMSRDQLQEFISQIHNNYSALEYLSLSRNMLLMNRLNPSCLNGHVYLHLD